MIICAIVGCPNISKLAHGISFYRLPAFISHQGEKAKELSQRGQDLWLAWIHRCSLGPEKYPNTRICGLHFVPGKLLHDVWIVYTLVTLSVFIIQVNQVNSDKKSIDWAPSINLGHGGAPIVSLSTDQYDRAVWKNKNQGCSQGGKCPPFFSIAWQAANNVKRRCERAQRTVHTGQLMERQLWLLTFTWDLPYPSG